VTRRLGVALACGLLVAHARAARAQANLQLWSNVTVDWTKSTRLAYELDFEPKVLLKAPEGDPGWRNLDVTPNVEYAVKDWLDLIGEATVGYTKQTDDANTFELTPRVGVRFHLFSRSVPTALPRFRELPPKRRVVVRDRVLFESRSFFYLDAGSGSSSDVRLRNRLELLMPINRANLTDDGARYWFVDWEAFVPAGEPDERFANKQRFRVGLGYRPSVAWRFEAVYAWTRSRNTIDEGFQSSDNIIDLRLKRVF
jgi:uncharacterized protein DUF2490